MILVSSALAKGLVEVVVVAVGAAVVVAAVDAAVS